VHEIFGEGWQWADEQMNKFWLVGWLEFNVPFQHKYGYIRDELNFGGDPYRDTGKTCLGGGMRGPSASSFCIISN